MSINNQALRDYADLLQANGFEVYEPQGRISSEYFLYSQMIGHKECFGYVQAERFGGYSHTMPIKPSVQHGSSMFVQSVPSGDEALTLENARRVARLTNWNSLVGHQNNYERPDFIQRSYRKRGRPGEMACCTSKIGPPCGHKATD